MTNTADLKDAGTTVIEPRTGRGLMDLDVNRLLYPLVSSGSLLLRNFTPSPQHFETFTRGFCHRFYPASNRNIRKPPAGDGYSNLVAPANIHLVGHTEGTYRPYPIHDELSVGHRWQAGDVLIMDNSRILQGRTMTAVPCERRIATCFGWLHPDMLPENPRHH